MISKLDTVLEKVAKVEKTNKNEVEVCFKAWVNESNGHKWLSQKGLYITDFNHNPIEQLDQDEYYKVTGKGINKELLEGLVKGEAVLVKGKLIINKIANDGFRTIVVL